VHRYNAAGIDCLKLLPPGGRLYRKGRPLRYSRHVMCIIAAALHVERRWTAIEGAKQMPSVLDKPYFQNEAKAYAKLQSIV
jgi:hypothetical protein